MSLTLHDCYDNAPFMGVAVYEAISFIVEALKDPLNPSWCLPSILACILVINPDLPEGQDDGEEREALINRNHPFAAAIVAFITVQRSVSSIKKLANRWSKCNCAYTGISAHDPAMRIHQIVTMMGINRGRPYGEDGNMDEIETIVRNFSQWIEGAIVKVKPFSIAKGRHPDLWPATPKDIIPYGPETTIESLVRWSRLFDTARVFSLIHLFVHICGPVMVPAIVTSRSTPNFMVDHGLQICSNIFSVPLDAKGEVDVVNVEIFIHELRWTGSLIHSIRNLPPLLYRDFHFGVATSTFNFATRTLATINSPIIPKSHRSWLEPWVDRLAKYGALLYTTLAEQMTVPVARVHPAIRTEMDQMGTPSPPAEFACEMMRHARSIQFCFAPGCPESAQSSGRVYKRCSGCRVVAYCSVQCQTRAWTDKDHPHKDICKKMKQVYDIGGDYLRREADQDKFVREMKRAEIKDTMLQGIGLWLSTAYMKLQRNGPLLTSSVRQYLLEKKGPLYAKGAEKHLDHIESALLSKPKSRKGRK